ncbi:hypothetical protein [Paenibacillus hexagrammi]|uniref:Uncharacterized protein n=1 Tax=Paenibacillus hexagrammi TaxID=2908839 RepID=A0ABY3SSI3_9BACL|nr:hypothetical protein [Paenibacillus sp. YPD9-1]UJF36604.1 hypothetical protein L0M14_30410 [Paenibacillus sp. YPD9-1]
MKEQLANILALCLESKAEDFEQGKQEKFWIGTVKIPPAMAKKEESA